jgi:hypothetical protein
MLAGKQNQKNPNPSARDSKKGLSSDPHYEPFDGCAGVKPWRRRAVQIPQSGKNFQIFLAPVRNVQDTKTGFSDTRSPNRPCSRHSRVRLIDLIPDWLGPRWH